VTIKTDKQKTHIDNAFAQIKLGFLLVVNTFQLEQGGVFLLIALTSLESGEDGTDVQTTSVRLGTSGFSSGLSHFHRLNLKALL
jgi:hypothetical protein